MVLSGVDNVMDFVEMRYGVDNQLLIDGATATISNSKFNNSSGDAIRIQNADPTLTGVIFENNNNAAISIDLSSNPVITGVTASNNFTNGLRLDSGTSTKNLDWTNPDITYVISGDTTIDAAHTLLIGPGQVIKTISSLSDLFVVGTLDARGTVGNPIVFTHIRDDTVGGDTNNDIAGTAPFNGAWGQVVLSGVDNVLDFVEMHYGADNQLLIDGATATISNSKFNNSSGDAIRIQNADPTLTEVIFENNNNAAISIDLSSNPVITGVTASNNFTNGLRLDSGTSTKNLNWTNPDITYVISGDTTIDAGHTLMIGPGQVIKTISSLSDLFVVGTIDAQGTAGNPIVFTHIRDDTVGGDTNNDIAGTAPFNGAWGRIVLSGTGNLIDFVQMFYGAANQLLIDGATATISNSRFNHSSGDSIRILNADPTLTDLSFENNNSAAISMDLSSNPVISGVAVTGNGTNGLRVDSGTSVKNLTWTNPDVTYVITGDITIDAAHTLMIGPGQVIKTTSSLADLQVDGTLDAQGTAGNPIVFTDDADDTVGGDTNNDADATAPFRGAWGRINFNPTSVNNTIDHTHIAYGGDAMLNVLSNGLTLTNSIVRESSGDAVEVSGGLATLESNLIFDNSDDGITALAGGTVIAINNTIDSNFRGVNADGAATTVELTNNLITFHTRSGVFTSGGAAITATFNDVFNPDSTHGNYEGLADPTGVDGNLSADPAYVSRALSNFSLLSGATPIDAGTSDSAPTIDFLGNSRFDDPGIANIGGGAIPFYDMGALERQDVSDPINLIVETVGLSVSEAEIGDPITVSWTIKNDEIVTAMGDWTDAVFASKDPVWDIEDTLLGEVDRIGDLAPGESYAAQTTIATPPGLPGTHYLIVRTDFSQQVRESVEVDNSSATPVEITIQDIVLDVPIGFSLSTERPEKYFRLEIDEETLAADLNVFLDDADDLGTNELYVRLEDIPGRQEFDTRSSQVGADQEVQALLLEPGAYFLLVHAASVVAEPAAMTIGASLREFEVAAIEPLSGGNAGGITVFISGAAFSEPATVRLTGPGSTVREAEELTFENSSSLYASFDLRGLAAGSYQLEVEQTFGNLQEENDEIVYVEETRVVASAEPFAVVDGGDTDVDLTLRSGTCLKCDTCGSTTGCS